MADEAFEAFWKLKGGPELVGLQSLFGGASLSGEEVRQMLGLTLEQFRIAVLAAQQLGLAEQADDRIRFAAFPRDSAQGARLEWCLEARQEEMKTILGRLKSLLLIRFLGAPPHPGA